MVIGKTPATGNESIKIHFYQLHPTGSDNRFYFYYFISNSMKKGEYPKCPDCGQAMIWTYAFPYKEYACLPCDQTAPMFNGLKKVKRSDKYMYAKKCKWQNDLTVIARTIGGAGCGVCKNGSCKYCKMANDKNYKFKYWKTNLNK